MNRHVLALLAIGLLGGFLSGVFGIGGGILMVPLFILVLRLDQRSASALSLTAVLPAAIVGSITYGLAGDIDLIASACIAIGGIGGALIGTRLLRALSLGWLRWLFVGLLVLVAVRMLLFIPDSSTVLEFTPLTVMGLIALGVVVGIASGLFGIGGGVIIVPALMALFGVPDLVAKGTSLLAIIPTSITGSIANTRAKLVRPLHGLTVGAAAALGAYPGALVAHVMPTLLSTVLFASLVIIAAVQLAIRAWRSRGS